MSTNATIERRSVDLANIEVRDGDADGPLQFRGYAAVFDAETSIGGWFTERIASGAFTKTIKDGADVRLLFNHEPDTVMARTTTGTLRLSEDDHGLLVEADLNPDDFDVARIAQKMRDGNVSQMSFAFAPVKEEWDEGTDPATRTLKEVKLFDVSPVTYPAYPQTEAALRDALSAAAQRAALSGIKLPGLTEAGDVDPEEVRAEIAKLEALLRDATDEPEVEPDSHSTHSLTADAAGRLIAIHRHRARVLGIALKE